MSVDYTRVADPRKISFSATVSTKKPESQLWMDRGFLLLIGYNHMESAYCFSQAGKCDPRLAMAKWAEAYALGPQYSSKKFIEVADMRDAYELVEQAVILSSFAEEWERELILATRARYPAHGCIDTDVRAAADRKFATKMQALAARFPDNPTILWIAADSLLLLHPWELWENDEPVEGTEEAENILTKALSQYPNHPGLLHLQIHCHEFGPKRHIALDACLDLWRLETGIGHLEHMPSHLFMQHGLYQLTIEGERRGRKNDEDAYYLGGSKENGFFNVTRMHNPHMGMWAAMMIGAKSEALEMAEYIETQLEKIDIDAGMRCVDSLEYFWSLRPHVLIRFGMWNEIIEDEKHERFEENPLLFGCSRSTWLYARSLAMAALGRVSEAREEQKSFLKSLEQVPTGRIVASNAFSDVMEVAKRMLQGEILYREGEFDSGFEMLREAMDLELRLKPVEPYAWMQPVAHALGALLLERGRKTEAAEVFRADLERYPKNVWSLVGLRDAMKDDETSDEEKMQAMSPRTVDSSTLDELEEERIQLKSTLKELEEEERLLSSKAKKIEVVSACGCSLAAMKTNGQRRVVDQCEKMKVEEDSEEIHENVSGTSDSRENRKGEVRSSCCCSH